MENITALMVFGAGFVSILSPCVLPVIPIVVAGRGDDHKLRPILIAAGISFSFIAMGVFSSLFGSLIGRFIFHLEKIAAVLIIISGLLMIFNVNLFKSMSFFSNIAAGSRGRFNGFFLGAVLGLVWIPCVGPILGSVLAMVASKGAVVPGILYLLVYSAGFSIPMIAAGYASHFFRKKISVVSGHQRMIGIVSGILLVAIGILILKIGMLGFGTLGF